MLYYKALDATGSVVFGNLPHGHDEKTLVQYLQSRGLVPLHISQQPLDTVSGVTATPRPASRPTWTNLSWSRGVDARSLISFASDVAVLLEAGISLPRALIILQDLNQKNRPFSRILSVIHEDLREGATFWEALEKQQPKIPRIFVSMVRAGETGGALPVILNRLGAYLEEMQELREYLRGAMIYPAILTATSLLSLVLMLTLVVPKFAQVFQDMGMELPGMTRFMFSASDVFQNHWLAMILGIFGITGGIWMALRTARVRTWWDRAVLSIPGIGSFKRKIEIARFCRTLGTLLDSGVPILQSMHIVQGVVINTVLNHALGQAAEDLKRGVVLSAALEKSGLFPSMTVNMVGVGEETGQLGQMLEKVGQLYDKEIKQGIKTFSSFFEPMVLLVMGTLIGGMVISMLMAIFSINDIQM